MNLLELPLTRFKKDNRKHRNKEVISDKQYLDRVLYQNNQTGLNLMKTGKIQRFDDEDYNIEPRNY